MAARLLGIGMLAVLIACGCQSPTGSPRLASSTGQALETVLQAHAGQRIEFFDADGKRVPSLSAGQRGSVSIYTQGQNGQDNYTVDDTGRIVKHLRSHGDDYLRGEWRQVR